MDFGCAWSFILVLNHMIDVTYHFMHGITSMFYKYYIGKIGYREAYFVI